MFIFSKIFVLVYLHVHLQQNLHLHQDVAGCWRSAVHAGLYLQSVKQLMQGQCYINRTWETCTQVFFFAW